MPRPWVSDLLFDDEEALEAHLKRHGLSLDDVYTLLEHDEYVVARNKNEHGPSRRRFIGEVNGALITAILEETSTPGEWVLVTAFPSNREDGNRYAKGRRHLNA